MSKEWHRDKWREADETDGCVEKEPGEVGWRAPGGFFKKTGVPLKEEDVEDEIQGKRSEIEECGYEAPILSNVSVKHD